VQTPLSAEAVFPAKTYFDFRRHAEQNGHGDRSCRRPSTALPDAPNDGAEEKVGLLRSR